MRNILISCLLALTAVAFSCSQQKDDEIAYSCNPEINQWAIDNAEELQKMTRKEFLELENLDYQFAALGVFSAEQKISIWKGKIDQVLSLNVWNDLEKNHIESLYTIIDNNKSWFKDNRLKTKSALESQENDILKTEYLWCEYAAETLHWTNEFTYKLISDPTDAVIANGKILPNTRYNTTINPDIKKKDCNCTELGADWGRSCYGPSCDTFKTCNTVHRCGLLGSSRCTGLCP